MSPSARMAALVAVLLPLAGTAGCVEWKEGMCSEGEVPLFALTNRHGGQCIEEGAPVPQGLATYPPGRVPEHVGDRYDRWPLAEDYPWADEVSPEVREQARALSRRDRQ